MRIVIDLQGAQSTASRSRGIGRYSLSLAKAIVRNRGEHEVIIALNAHFPETIEPIRAAFQDLLTQDSIRVWTILAPVDAANSLNAWRREAAERLREAFLASLRPDIILVSSLFEGLGDDAVTSIGSFSQSVPIAVTLFDLIPLIYRHHYFENHLYQSWYLRKLDHLRRANLWLSISESSRKEGIDYLGLPVDQVVNVSSAADDSFRVLPISFEDEQNLRRKYGLTKPFVMYTGGLDYRKNIEGLISAFSHLPEGIRRTHQLAIVCSAQPEIRNELENLALQNGMHAEEMILTGFVPEDDLVALYNLCKLFVFPSWHEGFGLPALEAMCCGAPVIASNTSSLPEVVGREDALFDPFSGESIAAKIHEVLTNDSFREELIQYGIEQAKKFSWDDSARRAISAMERFYAAQQINCIAVHLPSCCRPKLAYISPLPPERSGIADYSAELLPELSRHYDIDVVVAQPEVSDPWINSCLPIRTVEWFIKHINCYNRVLYHFGNSVFHQHMFYLLDRFPGVVVLHDFFLSSIKAHLDFNGYVPGAWVKELYDSHGYIAVSDSFYFKDKADAIFKYPCNFSVLKNSVGVIVHSRYSVDLAKEWYGDDLGDDWAVIPHLRTPARQINRMGARKKLDLNPDDFIVSSFGLLGPIKQNHRLLMAWLNSKLSHDRRCQLIFVGENHDDSYGAQLLSIISKSGVGERIRITGWVSAERFHDYLASSDMAVQLRTLSRGETSGTILDCMNYGLATIVNANGSIAGFPQDAVLMLPDEFEDTELIEALETLWRDAERRQALGARSREEILIHHSPRACADQYAKSIEAFYARAKTGRKALVDVLAGAEILPNEDGAIMALAAAIAQDLPYKRPSHQLLIDISELVQRDSKSGIQRVVRSILKELLHNPPPSYRVEPVYATEDRPGYRYAREFTLAFLQCPVVGLNDDPIEAYPGDIFFGLDLQPQVVPAQFDILESLRNSGVRIYFMVYDLLPILIPHAFLDGGKSSHIKWLNAIIGFDGAICISRSVADELREWIACNGLSRFRPFRIGYFHLGADIENSVPTRGLASSTPQVLAQLRARPTFLMVGTIEPRKGQRQTLDAFEKIWSNGVDVNLVIVGKEGWMVEDLAERLHHHPEQGERLFWLQGISDEYLEKVYSASTCLIIASEAEGFGLVLIEAARRRLSIIARDVPVFREVAGEHAFYFKGKEPDDLAKAVQKWLKLYQSERHPKSDDMPWLTWRQSTQELLDIMLNERWYANCMREESN